MLSLSIYGVLIYIYMLSLSKYRYIHSCPEHVIQVEPQRTYSTCTVYSTVDIFAPILERETM